MEAYCWHYWLEVELLRDNVDRFLTNHDMITFHTSFMECNDMIMWYMQLNETNSFPIKSMSNIYNCLLQLIRYKLPIQCHVITSCTSLFVIIMYTIYTLYVLTVKEYLGVNDILKTGLYLKYLYLKLNTYKKYITTFPACLEDNERLHLDLAWWIV